MPKHEVSMPAEELAQRLARQAEAVCQHYLPAGRRQGGYWLVGDVHNTPGRSLFVRLSGGGRGKGAVGRWQDAATGEHGDLLDLIRERCGFSEFRDVADEARRFLGLPRSAWNSATGNRDAPPALVSVPRIPPIVPDLAGAGAPDPGVLRAQHVAGRLFASAQGLRGTLAEAYLHGRGITSAAFAGTDALRFHSRCFYRATPAAQPEPWPALIAAVTGLDGAITGVQRTWLDPAGFDPLRLGKAPVDTPRRALGLLLGHAVRFGTAEDVMAAGEGIETVLSLRSVLPTMPMTAALSAAHLAALLFPANLRRLYIARDADPAGDGAVLRLIERTEAAGIEALVLSPQLGDFNDDLRDLGLSALRTSLWGQLLPKDVVRFMPLG